MAAKAVEVDVQGRKLRLSNLEKVLYPEAGFTKGQVIDYYTRAAPVLLDHLRGRALTLKRYPNGVDDKYFYEKQKPSHAPEWVRSMPIQSGRRGDHRVIDYVPVRRPAHDGVAGQPGRPGAAPVAGAGRGPRLADRHGLRPGPGRAGRARASAARSR